MFTHHAANIFGLFGADSKLVTLYKFTSLKNEKFNKFFHW